MRETSSDRGFDSRFDVAFQPGFDDRPAASEEFDPFGLSVPDRDDPRLFDGEQNGEEPLQAPVRYIDRFLIAIWVAGAVFVVFGIAGMAYGARSYYGTEGGGPDYFSIVAMQFSPWLIVLGLGTLVGSIFLLASRSDRRAVRRSDRRP
ncbi:hypothetical protein [Herbiconiux sp.]|uniref:hypothetical protein n=1 Tax=Herbiconiux sp. TaxID=1871186 RepID=UPI0025BFC785|nr:hypothetical protein [Herbiconiux sp.]